MEYNCLISLDIDLSVATNGRRVNSLKVNVLKVIIPSEYEYTLSVLVESTMKL